MARINQLFTVGVAPFRISDGANAASVANPNGEGLPPCVINDLSVQAYPGNAGVIYLMLGIPLGVTANHATVGHLTAVINPPAAAPGAGGQAEVAKHGWGPITGTTDGNKAWVDGSNAGDKIIVSYERID